MNFQINFQKAKRNYMTLTFDDEREVEKDGISTIEEYERKIMVGMPKKRIMEILMDLQDVLSNREEAQDEKEENTNSREMLNDIYDLMAAVLSNNMKGERTTTEWVGEQMDFEQIKNFLFEYVKFCKGEASSPN